MGCLANSWASDTSRWSQRQRSEGPRGEAEERGHRSKRTVTTFDGLVKSLVEVAGWHLCRSWSGRLCLLLHLPRNLHSRFTKSCACHDICKTGSRGPAATVRAAAGPGGCQVLCRPRKLHDRQPRASSGRAELAGREEK